MLYPTVPFPLPATPDVTAIHETSLAALHAHPGSLATEMVPCPPEADTEADVGWME